MTQVIMFETVTSADVDRLIAEATADLPTQEFIVPTPSDTVTDLLNEIETLKDAVEFALAHCDEYDQLLDEGEPLPEALSRDVMDARQLLERLQNYPTYEDVHLRLDESVEAYLDTLEDEDEDEE